MHVECLKDNPCPRCSCKSLLLFLLILNVSKREDLLSLCSLSDFLFLFNFSSFNLGLAVEVNILSTSKRDLNAYTTLDKVVADGQLCRHRQQHKRIGTGSSVLRILYDIATLQTLPALHSESPVHLMPNQPRRLRPMHLRLMIPSQCLHNIGHASPYQIQQ